MPRRHPADDSPATAGLPVSDSTDPEDADRDHALRLEVEPTDCNDPAAVLGWCQKAHVFLEQYLQRHKSYRHHQGDGVCQIIARATYARARRSPFCPVELVHLLGPQPLTPPWIAGDVALGNLQRLAQCCERQPKGAAPTSHPFTEAEQKVLELIKAQPLGTGILGRQIVAELTKRGFPLEQGTLTRHVIPPLKRYGGVKNRPNVGYYCDPA